MRPSLRWPTPGAALALVLGMCCATAASGRARAPAPRYTPLGVQGPKWFHFNATHRTRYEHLWNQFREDIRGNDMVIAMRTTFLGELRFAPFVIGAELQDARIYLADHDTPVDTTLVNPFELLQGYVGAEIHDLFMPGATGKFRAGRMTMDVGSRRFVARNRFRNTINAFTGVDLQWISPPKDTARVFVTFPVQRRPTGRDDLVDNDVEFDREHAETVFWGAFFESRAWAGNRGEAYLFGLHEQDSAGAPTSNRRLLTPGLRFHRETGLGALDYDVEVAGQFGSSRNTARADDTETLKHIGFFVHGALGYTIETPWTPRPVVEYDYATGDVAPGDGGNDRFDSLFGARRFDFGPTGIYGALGRSNINSPGLRVEVEPFSAVEAFVGYRAVWLAQPRDAWTASGLRDASGDSGEFVGNQLEGCILINLLGGVISVETGFSHMWLGRFPKSASAGTAHDPTYVYAQIGFKI